MTCYQYLTENKINFTKADVSRIGLAACKTAKEQNINYPKIKQQEGKHTYSVSDFPNSFTPTIVLVTKNYFEEQAAKAIILAKQVVKPIAKKEVLKPKPIFDNKKINVQIKKVRKRIPLKPELKKK